jgi:TolA-binding protein
MKHFILLLILVSMCGCLQTRSEVNEAEEQKAVQNQISEIRQSKTDDLMRAQTYENELRSLNGRIEVLERKLAEKQQDRNSEEKERAKQSKDLLDQMKIFEESIAAIHQRLDKLEKPPKVEEAKVEELPKGGKKKTTWEKAEELYTKKDWKNAALAFQNYQETNPKGSNVSLAVYKIGICFQELKMKDDAKSFFEEVISKYPNSPSAKKAKYRLNQMK